MKAPRNASESSAPDRLSGLIHRRGVLSQSGKPWGEAVCLDAQGRHLFFAVLQRYGQEILQPGCATEFRATIASGMLAVSGTLARAAPHRSDGALSDALCLDVGPEGVTHLNRREHYRVSVTIPGELTALGAREFPPFIQDAWGLSRGAQGHSQPKSPSQALTQPARPCVLRDLSVGGSRLALAAPAPRPGANALLHLVSCPWLEEPLRNLPCTVVQAKAAVFAPPFDALVRVHFVSLPQAIEGRLSRCVTRAQMELLSKGVKG